MSTTADAVFTTNATYVKANFANEPHFANSTNASDINANSITANYSTAATFYFNKLEVC